MIDEIQITVIEEPEITLLDSSTIAPKFSKVICHQCGSLFSGQNAECKVFDEDDPKQQGFCEPGEACLWYSWQKTKDDTAYVRECFSKSILLGTLENQLIAKEYCEPQDISEGSQKVEACLCETDFCNSYRGTDEPVPDSLPKEEESKQSYSLTKTEIDKNKINPVDITDQSIRNYDNASKHKKIPSLVTYDQIS